MIVDPETIKAYGVLLGVMFAGVVSLGNAIQTWLANKRANTQRTALSDQVEVVRGLADGTHKELERQNVALKLTAAKGEPIPEQIPGTPGNEPVGKSEGVVTVEKDQTARNRREGDT